MQPGFSLGSAVAATGLVVGIVEGDTHGGATELLTIGALVWIALVIAFELWYWHLDPGGRPRGRPAIPGEVSPPAASSRPGAILGGEVECSAGSALRRAVLLGHGRVDVGHDPLGKR